MSEKETLSEQIVRRLKKGDASLAELVSIKKAARHNVLDALRRLWKDKALRPYITLNPDSSSRKIGDEEIWFHYIIKPEANRFETSEEISELINRMYSENPRDKQSARLDFIELYIDRWRVTEAINRKEGIRKLISESNPPRPQIEAENIYEKYMKRSEGTIRQDADKLIQILAVMSSLREAVAISLAVRDRKGRYDIPNPDRPDQLMIWTSKR